MKFLCAVRQNHFHNSLSLLDISVTQYVRPTAAVLSGKDVALLLPTDACLCIYMFVLGVFTVHSVFVVRWRRLGDQALV